MLNRTTEEQYDQLHHPSRPTPARHKPPNSGEQQMQHLAKDYHAVYPPSITRCDPVMNEEASLNMKSAAPLYSRGSDIRPNMFSFSQSSRSPGSSSKFFRTIYTSVRTST
jgi:hypothetical protein